MVDLMNTALGEQLRKAQLLSDAVAWLQLHTPQLRSTIIREWIQKDQLTARGVDEFGNIIGHYSLATEFISDGRKKEGDHYTLEDTGAFYRSMFITVLANEIIIDADSSKMEDQHWWREEILGLTDENLQKYIFLAKDGFINYARRILGLN